MSQDKETRDEQIDRFFMELGARIYAVECMTLGLCLRLARTVSNDPKTEVKELINDAHHVMNLLNEFGGTALKGVAEARIHLYNRLKEVQKLDDLVNQSKP